VIVTPRIFNDVSLVMSGSGAGGATFCFFLLSLKNTSLVFDLFRDRLLFRAHVSTFSISVVLVLTLVAGITRYVSSANFTNLLPESFTVRSPAVTTYAAGPIAEP